VRVLRAVPGVEWETEGGGLLLGRRVRVGLVRAALITASKYVSIFSNPIPFNNEPIRANPLQLPGLRGRI
jgi:hypothetical protein